MTRVDLPIEGMTCAACVRRVDRALAKLDGVEHSEVSLAAAAASVSYDDELISADDIAARIEQLGYSVPEVVDVAAERRDAARRAAIGLAMAVATMVFTMGPFRDETWARMAAALLSSVAVWGVGRGFHRRALAALADRSLGMDALVSLGTVTAWTWSMAVLLGLVNGHLHFGEAATIVGIILVGEWLEARARGQARASLEALASLASPNALLVDGTVIASDQLQIGQQFVVRSGESLPADGTVADGRASVDTSMITGEPLPVDVAAGDAVTAGTVVVSGRVVASATRVGAETTVAQIGRLVARAQASHAPIQRLADKVAGVFVPIILVIAAGTFIGWLATGHSLSEAVAPTVAVLVIACPCALGLATPMAIMVGTGRGAEMGVLIRDGSVLERAHGIGQIVLDKTGTITAGRMTVVEVKPAPGQSLDEVRRLGAAVAAASPHPASQAVAEAGPQDVPTPTEVTEQPGIGVAAVVEGRELELGRPVGEVPIDHPSVVELRRDGAPMGWFGLQDQIKSTSRTAIDYLHDMDITTVLLSGDRPQAAEAVAKAVGIDEAVGGLHPGDKERIVGGYVDDGQQVAMVGDGSNDAPALARATLGMAMGAGTDVARNAADITLVANDLLAAVDALRLSNRTLATIKGNLFWAFAYNVAAIPAAAAGLLNPMIAAAAMSFSSLFVVGNSLRLRGFRSVRRPGSQPDHDAAGVVGAAHR